MSNPQIFKWESKFFVKYLIFVLFLLKTEILHLYSLTYFLSCLNWTQSNGKLSVLNNISFGFEMTSLILVENHVVKTDSFSIDF